MERKLASIQRIVDISPIPNADAIEVATVNSWKSVVSKSNNFSLGDLVVYFEIDSFLPITPEFEFLRKASYKKLPDGTEGFVLRTVKLRGQLSQGLITPISILGDLTSTFLEGDDVSSALGVTKYEPPIPAQLSGIVKGNFPSFIRKTDEERIQNLTGQYSDLKANTYYVTEKLDGTSSTFYFRDGTFGACSRNLELKEPEDRNLESLPTFWRIAWNLGLHKKFENLNKNIAIQGEIIGPGIQKNPYKLNTASFRLFSVFDIDTQTYYDLDGLISFANDFGLETVPVISTSFSLPETIDELIEMAKGPSSLLSDYVDREGIVIRTHDKEVSFKAISNSFLLNEKD